MQVFRRDNEEGKVLLGDSAHPTARSRQPGGAREAPASRAGCKVLTSLWVTPGKSRDLRRESSPRRARRRLYPDGASRQTPPRLARAPRCLQPPRLGETLVRLRRATGDGFARPGTSGSQYRVPGNVERGAARSGVARAAGEPGWRAAGRCLA